MRLLHGVLEVACPQGCSKDARGRLLNAAARVSVPLPATAAELGGRGDGYADPLRVEAGRCLPSAAKRSKPQPHDCCSCTERAGQAPSR